MSLLSLLFAPKDRVLGMNRRNCELIHGKNRRADFPIANDKLRAKQVLTEAGVPVAATLFTFETFRELDSLEARLGKLVEFVVKPARGHGGRGILVIAGRNNDEYVSAGGRAITRDELRRHLADIIFGVYTLDRPDFAIVEPRLRPHGFFANLYPEGLSDIRILSVDEAPVLAMARVPTRASDGRANLHQGAIGLGVDIETGVVERARLRGRPIDVHPDSRQPLLGHEVPFWDRILEIARTIAATVPLKYLGMDLVIDRDLGPLALEINARPGLEIQNITQKPLRRAIEEVSG